MLHRVNVMYDVYVEGWVEQGEVIVIPEFAGVRLSVAEGMLDATDQEWSDYLSMFGRAVRHVRYFQISHCPGQCKDIIIGRVCYDLWVSAPLHTGDVTNRV